MKHACGFDSCARLTCLRQHPVAEELEQEHLGEMTGRQGSSIQLSRGQSLYSTKSRNRTAHRTRTPFFLILLDTRYYSILMANVLCTSYCMQSYTIRRFVSVVATVSAARTSSPLRNRVGLHTSPASTSRGRSCHRLVFPLQHPSTAIADDGAPCAPAAALDGDGGVVYR